MSRRRDTSLGDPGLRHRMRGEERRIEGQHQRLDALCREVCALLATAGTDAAHDDYLLFMGALDAHMTMEEEVHFPALHGLRSDLSEELSDLAEAHETFRQQAGAIKALFEAHDRLAARGALERLRHDFGEHETIEEELLVQVNRGSVAAPARRRSRSRCRCGRGRGCPRPS